MVLCYTKTSLVKCPNSTSIITSRSWSKAFRVVDVWNMVELQLFTLVTTVKQLLASSKLRTKRAWTRLSFDLERYIVTSIQKHLHNCDLKENDCVHVLPLLKKVTIHHARHF